MADPQSNYYFTNMDGVTINPGDSGCITVNDATFGMESVVAEVMSHPSVNNSSMNATEELKIENMSNDCWMHLPEPSLPLDPTAFAHLLSRSEENEHWDLPQEQKVTPQEQTFFPPEEATDLSNQDYPGPYNFKVVINQPGIKSPWEYSHSLNKMYTDVSRKFPLSFRLELRPLDDLYIRATPVFEEAQHSQEFVYRCISHLHADDPTNIGIDANVVQHIMRCQNVRTRYHGSKSKRLNCVIPLGFPGEGTTDVQELFQFVCKNSCASPSGMNRRPIQVIFTLEDSRGTIWGRRVVNFRICSVPKRDKKKEEIDRERAANPPPARTGNRTPANPTGASKRRKVDDNNPPTGKSTKPYLSLSYHKANGEVDSLDIRLFGNVMTDAVLHDVKKRVADNNLDFDHTNMITYEKVEELIKWSKDEGPQRQNE